MSEAGNQESEELQKKDDQSPVGDSPKPQDPRFDATTETFVDSTRIIGTEIGRYHILSVLGEGGGGVVYLAQQNHPIKRRVALKVIKPGMDSKQVIARFEAERQALALLDHPNIAHVFDAGATDLGRPYFVMEFVKGIPITEFCDQGKLTLSERLRLFIPLCHAIQHAHQKGIIHRDIKPSNALVMLQDNKPISKIIDFGVAKALHQPLTDRTMVTMQGQFVGTPEYMSPEQAETSNLDVDTRSDIYSLGVLLYEMLTGCTPFDPKDLRSKGYGEMQRIIREQEPIKPSTRVTTLGGKLEEIAKRRSAKVDQLRKSLRNDLDWIVMKAMEKDRSRRYATASDLAEDLERHLNNEPVLARPPSKIYKFRKMARRNKGLFAAVAVVAAALILGAIVSTWQAVRANEESRIAETERQRAEEGEKYAERLLYVANMNLVQQAWEQNNVGRVRQLLDETAAYPDRGFEWYYWQRQTHLELKTLRGHTGRILSVAFSPDGRRIVTGSEDKTAKVWDAATGKELTTLTGHIARIVSVAFSPDGHWIATGSADQTAIVWEALNGNKLRTLRGHTAGILSVAFSPDSQWIATGSEDHTAKVWEVTTDKEPRSLKEHTIGVTSVAFSPDGQRIATGSGDQTAKVWEASTGKKLFNLETHNGPIFSLAYSPDGQRIVIGSLDNTARVWDAASGTKLLDLKGHSELIWSVAYSPDGRRIVTGSWDQTAKVWDANNGNELRTIKGHSSRIRSVAFSPDGQRIITGSWDQTAKVWNAAEDTEPLTLKGHNAEVFSVAVSPDGQRIITGSGTDDKTAKVWDAITGKELHTLTGHSGWIFSVAYSPDGRRIVTTGSDYTAKIWEAATYSELSPLILKEHSGQIWSAAYSPDGQRIVTGCEDHTVRVWDAATGKELFPLNGHKARVISAVFSPDSQRIVTGSDDHTAIVWDAANGNKLHTLKGHSFYIRSVAFSPDSQRIVTCSWDQTAKVWDATTGKELSTLTGHSAPIWSVAFSYDGHRIVTGSFDQTAKVWEATTGKELLTLKGHGSGVLSVAFSPDRHRIVTGSDDHTAKVWEAATEQQVTAWQREEQTAGERVALVRLEEAATAEHARALRVQDPGAIKQWLVLAPIPYDGKSQSGAVMLDQEQIPGEASLRPRAGERVKVGENELVWKAFQLEDYLIDFDYLLNAMAYWSVAYAVCYIQSETNQTGLIMKVGSDDQAKVYLNGKKVYHSGVTRSYVPDQDAVAEIDLKAGINILIFKVVNEGGDWMGSVWLTDSAGKPVKGIRVTLDPDGKD